VNLNRFSGNPILMPKSENAWESKLVFNPGSYLSGNKIHILYRAVDKNNISHIGYASSIDGFKIDERLETPVITPEYEWENLGIEDVRVNNINNNIYITYTAFSTNGPRVAIAETQDFKSFKKKGLIGPDHYDKDAVFFPKRIDGKIILLHRIEPNIQLAYFDNLENIFNPPKEYWKENMANIGNYTLLKPEQEWEMAKIGAGPPPIETGQGWILLYHGVDQFKVYRVGAVLLDLDEPTKIIARSAQPLLQPEEWYEHWGYIPDVVFPTGTALIDETLYIYYGAADTTCCVATININCFLKKLKQCN